MTHEEVHQDVLAIPELKSNLKEHLYTILDNGECKRAQAEWPKWKKLVANKWAFHSTEKSFYFLAKQWFALQT
jgi:hypothetical protein